MRRNILAGIAACLMAGVTFQAHAQQNPGFTPQELDRMSQERTAVFGAVKHGPPPPQSEISEKKTYQPSELWICKGTTAWQPVYSQPNTASPQIGKTMNMIAVGGRDQNGFARILFPNGKIGWVPASQIHDYVNEFHPHATCQISRVRANGGPVFDIR